MAPVEITAADESKSKKRIEELKEEIRLLKEEHEREKCEAQIQISAFQSQIERQLSLHRNELKKAAEDMDAEMKQWKEYEVQMQKDLLKKAANHTEELHEVIDHHRQQLEQSEAQQQNLIRELNEHFQSEIKVAHHQWQQVIALTWEADRNDIEVTDTNLGKGRFSSIMKGNFRGLQVAVKKVHPGLISEVNEKLVRWEINLLAQIRHPNLVLFLGAALSDSESKEESTLIVTELLHTSLRSAYQQGNISANSKIPILSDVASGLTYLHTNRVPIIHRNVSSSAILLEAIGGEHQWKAKLSIFGLANVLPNEFTPSVAGSYAAPEIISADSRHQTDKTDVYSFGVLICEVILCRCPPAERDDFPIMLSDVYAHDQNLFQLAMNCTKQSHKDRPSMIEAMMELKALPE